MRGVSEPSSEQLVRWAESLAGIAQTGLAFASSDYDRERMHEIMAIAADIRAGDAAAHTSRWLSEVAVGVPGYAAAKSAVGALVGNDRGELLLIQRSDSHRWFFPTGWADVGYSLSEVVIKEVKEETGLDVRPSRIAGLVDGMRAGSDIAHHITLFTCELIGGTITPHPLECDDVRWFGRDELPEDLVGMGAWVELAYAAIDGSLTDAHFDEPRDPVWRTD